MSFADDVNDAEQYPNGNNRGTNCMWSSHYKAGNACDVSSQHQYVVWIFTTEFPVEFCLHCVNPFSNELHRPIISVRILIEFCCSAIPYCPLALFTDNIYLYKSLYSYIK